MLTPSPEIIQLLLPFAPALTRATWDKLVLLFCGALLAPGRRTVAAAVRAIGRGHDVHFTNFHRVFNRARWSALVLARRLFLQLLALVPRGEPVVLLIDETLVRRWGPQVRYKGLFRDAVRSTKAHIAFSWGIRWCCVCLLVPVPWSPRRWALPFLAVPVRSKKTCAHQGKRHVGTLSWAARLLARIRRWVPAREVVVVGDGAYAAVSLVRNCQQASPEMRLVTRLRFDAALYDTPPPQSPHKRGPKPKKGHRQPSLAVRLTAPETAWATVEVAWYGGRSERVQWATGTALWHTSGQDPVPLRWLLVRPAPRRDGEKPVGWEPAALCCSDPTVSPAEILAWFLGRWNIEVTFAELRAHLGFETQRQWSGWAVGRATPCLCGVFSLAVLLAQRLYPRTLPLQCSGWYAKAEATFSDVLAAVRAHLWGLENIPTCPSDPDRCLIPRTLLAALQQAACHAP
jgi:hypothetical protein